MAAAILVNPVTNICYSRIACGDIGGLCRNLAREYCHQVDDENHIDTFPMPMIIAGDHLRVNYTSGEEEFPRRGDEY